MSRKASTTNQLNKANQFGINNEREYDFVTPTAEELDKENEKQLDDFNSLLDSMSTTEQKTKALYKQIYQNAVTDRRNAYVLFGELYNLVNNDATAHSVQGPNLAKYLERMSKANEQLIKLAEMISEEINSAQEEAFSSENLYAQING